MNEDERKYSIHMFKQNIIGYRKNLFSSAKINNWDDVIYWANAIKEREALIKSHQDELSG